MLDIFPLWVLFILTIGLVLLSIEGGHQLAKYQQKRPQKLSETSIGTTVGAILGLLAFMLAFTFSFAASRFEDRKQIVLDETNAIGTTYLRAGFMPEPIRTETRNILRQYVDARIDYGLGNNREAAILKSQELQSQLWLQAVLAADKNNAPVNLLFIQTVNEVIDLHGKRLNLGLRNRIPGMIWLVLYALIILSMVEIGYQGGLTKTKRAIINMPLVFAFSAVLLLIVDLDRPAEGILNVSQQALIDLKSSIASPETTIGK